LNISVPEYDPEITKAIEPFVYEWTSKKHGSISAEHGLGVMKAKYLHYSKSKNMIDWMKRVKSLFDPHDIMNPYKYIP
jgi:FAD/FMN-containing dehydrogenase